MAMGMGNAEMRYSGGEFERDVLGKGPMDRRLGADKDKENKRIETFKKKLEELQKKYSQSSEKKGYVPFDEAMRLIKENTVEDPTAPSSPFAQELMSQLTDLYADRFGLEDVEGEDLLFYNAVGTPLDHYHGIDAWVEIRGRDVKGNPTKHYNRVTLDATLNTDKFNYGTAKADVIVPEIHPPTAKPKANAPAVDLDRYRREKKRFQAEVKRIADSVISRAFGSK